MKSQIVLRLHMCIFINILFCRRIIILVKAGAPVDATIKTLLEFLEEGDIIIDGGNEW